MSTKLWTHLLSFGCALGRHSLVVLLFVQMFTRLKLNLHSLWSSVFLYPVVCDAPRPRHVCLPAGWRRLSSTAVRPPNIEIAHVRAVFRPVFFLYIYIYNVREILEELLIVCFIGMYLKCGEIWWLALLPLRGCPWMLEWLCLYTDDQVRPALHSLLCNWASLINWNSPCLAASHLIRSF